MNVTCSESPFHSFVTLTSYRDISLLRTGLLSFVAAQVGAAPIALYQGSPLADSNIWHWFLEEAYSGPAPELEAVLPLLNNLAQHPVAELDYQLCRDGFTGFPLKRKGKLTGVLLVASQDLHPQICQSIHALIAIYSNQLFWLDRSSHDALTGLLNRHVFDERIAQLALHNNPTFQRRGEDNHHEHHAHFLGIIDIDHFKKINDQFGHLYGDEVLVHVANTMRSSFRDSDWLFRFGGEEFVVVMRNVEHDVARTIFERFRNHIASRPFPQVGHISVSIGFGELNPANATNCIGDADKALYYAKSHGRNRCCQYEELLKTGALQPSHAHTGSIDLF